MGRRREWGVGVGGRGFGVVERRGREAVAPPLHIWVRPQQSQPCKSMFAAVVRRVCGFYQEGLGLAFWLNSPKPSNWAA